MKDTFDYKQYAKNYDNEKDFDRYLLLYKFDALRENRGRFGNILELGCAKGLMTELLLPAGETLDVVDISEEYVEYVKEKIGKKFPDTKTIRFFISFFEKFIPDRKYDTIILSGVIPALDNPVETLKLISKWLAPEGQIFITTHNAYSLHRRVGKIMGQIKDEHELSERDTKLFNHHIVYDKDILRRDVEEAGLQVVKQGAVYLKPFPNNVMENLDEKMIHAFYEVGKQMDPSFLAELYVFAKLPK